MKSTFTLLMFALLLLSCGSDKGSSPTRTTPPPPPVPSAAIQVMASGTITIHPSSDRRFGYATKFPIRIRETGGGSATWNFFRVAYFQRGRQIERFELGSDDLRQSGVRDITANSDSRISVTTRANAISFDALQILLGFSDNKDGRALVAELNLAGFDGVRNSPIPAVLPDGRNFSVEVSER